MSATPAPWHARVSKLDDSGEVRDNNGNWVARVHRRNADNASGEECAANTHMMAAAPEMYETLRALLAVYRDEPTIGTVEADYRRRSLLADAVFVIAKAEGKQ